MLIRPEEIDKLPRWLDLLISSFKRWAPQRVQNAIDDFVTEVVQPYEIDEDLPVKVRHTFQAISCWWLRISFGERNWADFMSEIAEDEMGLAA